MTTLNQAVRTFNQRRATQAALQNEMATRERVARLERMIWPNDGPALSVHERLVVLERLHRRSGFWGRVKWLLLGR